METKVEINEKKYVDDYFPAVFANANRSIIILADSRTTDRTFSGMVVHAAKETAKKTVLGTYSTGWTYEQFKRLPKGTELTLIITQENG